MYLKGCVVIGLPTSWRVGGNRMVHTPRTLIFVRGSYQFDGLESPLIGHRPVTKSAPFLLYPPIGERGKEGRVSSSTRVSNDSTLSCRETAGPCDLVLPIRRVGVVICLSLH